MIDKQQTDVIPRFFGGLKLIIYSYYKGLNGGRATTLQGFGELLGGMAHLFKFNEMAQKFYKPFIIFSLARYNILDIEMS
ncbi:MAG: hypothetical protein MZV70_11550 [Desulfobacterales bacterium]|nr:hypothetical protein [Desulfobacterales bacterium]